MKIVAKFNDFCGSLKLTRPNAKSNFTEQNSGSNLDLNLAQTGAGSNLTSKNRPAKPTLTPKFNPRELAGRALWLLGVAIFFYSSYGSANYLASLRVHVSEIAFSWERSVPFIAWSVLPYWSLNLLYALGFFLLPIKRLRRYVESLVLAQLIAVAVFVLFPLRFSWDKPDTGGLYGFFFASLGAFDQPFNQAPSLHIILCVIVGALYSSLGRLGALVVAAVAVAAALGAGVWWGALTAAICAVLLRLNLTSLLVWVWFVMIAISVLTTWQHHFIDIPTGLLVGAFVLWRVELCGGSNLTVSREMKQEGCKLNLDQIVQSGRARWASFYALLALAVGLICAVAGGAWLWGLWASVSFVLVATGYVWLGASVFVKRSDGRLAGSAKALLALYLLLAWLNAKLWLRGMPRSSQIMPEIWLGSVLESDKFDVVFDLTAEFEVSGAGKIYQNYPLLDMAIPSTAELNLAAAKLNELINLARAQDKSVLVCCALGYSRSAAVLVVWLVRYGGLESGCTLDLLRAKRPQIVLNERWQAQILRAIQDQKGVENE